MEGMSLAQQPTTFRPCQFPAALCFHWLLATLRFMCEY